MSETFSSAAWSRTLPIFEAIRTMPFVTALADGTLPLDRFRHFIIQDSHYLIAFARALALAAAKAPEAAEIVQFSRAAHDSVVVERALHDDYFVRFGIAPEDFTQTPLSPVCDHYVNFLVAKGFAEPYPVVLAATLPCFWIYAEVGRDILARAVRPNPYDAWIDTYAGEEFHDVVRAAIAATDRAAAQADPLTLVAMHAAYRRACQLEWMFWDSAWRLADWPVG
ncbi:thiaminase II [Ancylobacter sp. 6x-1]|uniref:Aminopyrimidine aminohydrolase n=1 Tax=Ancylobacter crimeensis TaxID=2579147 RepID=A0ABT0DBK2_9HYPH|nr:thiaminase II [Ancylobacter crimeensis]MCK0197343.1 thiaminase II [Ancylobacter crimeensis]